MSDVLHFADGFISALQQTTSAERVAAVRALVDKGLRLGVAIDQPPSDSKPVDITIAALELLGKIAATSNARI